MVDLINATAPAELEVIKYGLFFLVGMFTGGGIAICAFRQAMR